MKSLSFKKCQIDNQIYISQLNTSVFFYKLLFEVKKIDVRLNKTLKLKFILMFLYSIYPTRPSDTVTKYTIYPYLIGGKIIQIFLGLILLLYPTASKIQLKTALQFTFSDSIFAQVRFNKSFFFIPSF